MTKLDRWHPTRFLFTGVFVLLAAIAGCDDDDGITGNGGLEDEDFVGTWVAETFTVTQDGVTTDVLAEDGSLTLTLAAAGGVTGSLFAPGLGVGGADLNEVLTGSWSFDDLTNDVDFDIAGSALLTQEFDLDVDDSNGNDLQLEDQLTFGAVSVTLALTME